MIAASAAAVLRMPGRRKGAWLGCALQPAAHLGEQRFALSLALRARDAAKESVVREVGGTSAHGPSEVSPEEKLGGRPASAAARAGS